jgi:hypothetical protein
MYGQSGGLYTIRLLQSITKDRGIKGLTDNGFLWDFSSRTRLKTAACGRAIALLLSRSLSDYALSPISSLFVEN